MSAHEDHAHEIAHAKTHMHDVEAHVTAVENDPEYYRTKRLEPRIFHLARRGIVTLYDILGDTIFLAHLRRLTDLGIQSRLPGISPYTGSTLSATI